MDKHKLLFQGIRSIINKHDPINLIAGGAPHDEYDSEVLEIIRLLRNNKTELAEGIYKLFVNSFNNILAGNKNRYIEIAKEVNERYGSYL